MAKSKPTLNFVSHVTTSSSTVQTPMTSKNPGTHRTPSQQDWKSLIKTQRRVLNCDKKMQSLISGRRDSKRQKRTKNIWMSINNWRVRGNSYRLETQTSTVLAQKRPHNLHISTAYVWHLRKFSRMCDRDTVANRETNWNISMKIRLYGECFCPLLFKLQFKVGKITHRIYIPSKNQPKRTLKQLFM